MVLPGGYPLLYSGLPEGGRAAAGVGCFVNANTVKDVQQSKGWNERILTLEVKVKQ